MIQATICKNLDYKYTSHSVMNVNKTTDDAIIDNSMLNQTSDPSFNAAPCMTDSSNVNHNLEGSDNSCNEISDGKDDTNSMKLCSNCLNHFDFKIEESFENDTCGHILCLKCRFVQDNVCRLCKIKQQEEWQSSVALDLTTSFSSNLNDNVGSCNDSINNNDVPKKSKRKPRNFVLPDYIIVLPGEPPEYQCSICKRKFRYKLQSKYHETCFTGQRPLKCDICDKTFIKKCHLEYHQRTHSGDKPFVCNMCDKRFIQKNKLTRHLKVHSGEMPFKCEKCGKCFASKQRIDIHMLKHTNERPFPCRSCRRTFRDKVTLKNHEMRHSDKTFICEECGKKFTLHWNLILHRRRHSGYKPYACDFVGCSIRFVCRRDLIRHMQTHSDLEYDYECSICTTAFRRKDNLERHMRNAHPESMSLGNQRQIVSIVKVKDLPFGTNDNKTPKLPTCQKVSVISNSKSSSNDVKKLPKKNELDTEISSKKPVTLAPHRLITPPVRSVTDGSNCVPTITKVTHIIHTSDTGVSNIKTVITTRDVSGKTKADKSKQNKSTNNVCKEVNENELNSGVIRYVPKSSKSRTELKNKFYRVLGQSSNSSITTSCNAKNINNSSNNDNNNDINNLHADVESLNYNREDTVMSETSLSIRNIPYDNNNYNNNNNINDYNEFVTNYNNYLINENTTKHCENLENDFIDNYDNNVNNNFRNDPYVVNSFDRLKNDDFYGTDRINYVPPSSNIFNSNNFIQSYDNVSESCLLADNALDESLTAPLYDENDNNNRSNDINGYCS